MPYPAGLAYSSTGSPAMGEGANTKAVAPITDTNMNRNLLIRNLPMRSLYL